MSVPYHKELFNNGNVRLFANFSAITNDVADENIKLNFYATDNYGIPIFTEQLGISEVRDLYNHLNAISVIRDGQATSEKFIETTDEIKLILDKLNDSDLSLVLELLEKFESEEKVRGLLQSLSELEIDNLHGAFHHKQITREIGVLEELIDLELEGTIVEEVERRGHLQKYSSKQPERIFQKWIESNLWIFGVEYIKKHDVNKIAMFSEGDLLMESVDGYLDLIELKRPKASLLKFDKSHNCHYPHPELSQVLGQSLFYLQKLSEYKLNLEKEYEVRVIMPRIKIITGLNREFGDPENDCIRMLNSNLNSIQVITYDDLLNYGKLLLTVYEDKYDTPANAIL